MTPRRNGSPSEAADHLGRALELWKAPPLGAFATSFSVGDVVARWRELRGEAIERFFDARLALGDHREAIADLQGAVGEYPFREHLRVLLAVALYRSDRPVEALRSIDAARRALVDEAGVDPGPELRAVESMIHAEDPSLDPPPAVAAKIRASSAEPVSNPAAVPFVGRSVELDALVATLREVTTDESTGPKGRALVVSGEPGVGKSELVERLAAVARRVGCLVATARCSESTAAAPYWSWRSLAGSFDSVGGSDEFGRNLASILDTAADPGPDDGVSARLMVHVAIVDLLRQLPEPCLLIVDDLQWADAASLSLLELVANEMRRLPIALAVTVRAESEIDRRVRDCLAELSRSPGFVRLELGGIGREATAEWLTAALGDRATFDLTAIVHDRTGGNAFFVREMVALLAATEADGSVLEAAALAIPAAVHDTVRRRTSRLGADTQHLLTLAAVIGREFEVDVLAIVAGIPRERVLMLLEPAIDVRLLGIDPARPGMVNFAASSDRRCPGLRAEPDPQSPGSRRRRSGSRDAMGRRPRSGAATAGVPRVRRGNCRHC